MSQAPAHPAFRRRRPGALVAERRAPRWRSRADVEAQLAAAWRVVGAYDVAMGAMAGFARAFSDGAALAYLARVYVLPGHRGQGLGHGLVAAMVDEGPGATNRWLLHTEDAHGLDAGHGFAPPTAPCSSDRAVIPRLAS